MAAAAAASFPLRPAQIAGVIAHFERRLGVRLTCRSSCANKIEPLRLDGKTIVLVGFVNSL